MDWIPDKFRRFPFVTWGFVLLTIGFFVWLFGPAEILAILKWAIGMEAVQ